MATEPTHGHPRSTARIGDHPIHPMLVGFPIVCFILTFVADLLYTGGHDPAWATASGSVASTGCRPASGQRPAVSSA